MLSPRFALFLSCASCMALSAHAEETPAHVEEAPVKSDGTIVVTAGRAPTLARLSGASVTVFDQKDISAAAQPQVSDILRLAPGVSVSQAGPLGSQTQIRLRGAEANHTLVVIDGIIANDPASSGEFRFETLGTRGVDRIEVIRGPESAIWGAEAIGGVISVTTASPGKGPRTFIGGEGGSFNTWRTYGGASAGDDHLGLVARYHMVQSDGIDAFGAGGERDGFSNRTLSLKGVARHGDRLKLELVARQSLANSDFDGNDPATFLRANTRDASRILMNALRLGASLEGEHISHEADIQWLGSANGNFRDTTFLNRDEGDRLRGQYQANWQARMGRMHHRFSLAMTGERQLYRADDRQYFGQANQRRRRDRLSVTGEWRTQIAQSLAGQISLRHDDNDRFANALTLRTALAFANAAGWRAHINYGEGVADPTFSEQYGFFPGSFIGNPALRPEKSRGYEIGMGWGDQHIAIDLALFRTHLTSEITSVFDSTTFQTTVVNADGRSRRQGVDLSTRWQVSSTLNLRGAVSLLDATQPDTNGRPVREVRRPQFTASLLTDWRSGPYGISFTTAFVGARRDTDFALNQPVRLSPYALLTLAGRWQLSPMLELNARVENLGDARYQDVLGYATPGLGAYAGARLQW